jgi:CelD/BcsL family acetyltransferase involved in cellulose biosynthesis
MIQAHIQKNILNHPDEQRDENVDLLSSALQWTVHDSFESVPITRDEWDRFVLDVDGHIYMSYDWCRIWWEYYGRTSDLRVFIFMESGNLVGIVPIYIDSPFWGPLHMKIARVLGSNLPPKLSDIPVSERWARDIFKTVISVLADREQCDIISIGPLSGDYYALEALRKASGAIPDLVSIAKDGTVGEHTEFILPESYDAYLASLSYNERKLCRRKMKSLKKKYDFRLDVLKGVEEIKTEFPIFKKLHDRQWQSQGFLGHFMGWPKSEEFNTSLALAQAHLGRSRLFRLILNNIPASYEYVFKFGQRYYWRLRAREVGPEWDRFSLGRVGLLTLFAYGIDEGVRNIETGLGHYDYKEQLGARKQSTKVLTLITKRKGVSIRFHSFLLLAKGFDMLYQKIWIRRVAPRLRLKRRPLSLLWIRSRL